MSFEPLKNLNGQTAVITGANGGVGRATAQTLAASGARIVGIARRNIADLQSYLDQLPNSNLKHTAIKADTTTSGEFDRATKHITNCDILVNSAGFSRTIPHADLDLLTDEFFDEILTANLRSVFSTIRIFSSRLKQSSHGLIINISSASALTPGHGSNIAYVAAKAGVESMTKNLALAMAPTVRVISICPSSLNTGFLEHAQDFYDRAGSATPLKRVGTAEDIAAAVEAVATRMRFMTGNSLVVDGGRTL
jgi:NAD(P)-dependent dehydrogenase (short-subunit alcohol dehydrogenase family)